MPKVCSPPNVTNADILVLFSETEETVNWLMSVAPIATLRVPNLGGKVWAQLKRGELPLPPWEKICNTKFWVEEEWKSKREVLSGQRRAPQVQTEESFQFDEGTVQQEVLQLPSGEGKKMLWGNLPSVLAMATINVLWVEADDDEGLPATVPWAMSQAQAPEMHVIISGTPTAVEKAIEVGSNKGSFNDCTASLVSIYMPDDGALGGRGPLETSVERRALLVTRNDFGNQAEHLQYAVLHTKWCPGLTMYLLELLGMQGGADSVVNLMYLPHFGRSDKEC